MMKIEKTSYKDIKDFNKEEWRDADREHYGKDLDWDKEWKVRKIILKAVDDGKLVGALKLQIECGVAKIDTIIVTKAKRNIGIGKQLMLAAENAVKKRGCHKIWLETGKGWSAISLYESMGYEKVADLPKHYFKKNFILLSKFI